MNKRIKCCKCFITLERLKNDGIGEYLIKIVKENGKEDYICIVCLNGW